MTVRISHLVPRGIILLAGAFAIAPMIAHAGGLPRPAVAQSSTVVITPDPPVQNSAFTVQGTGCDTTVTPSPQIAYVNAQPVFPGTSESIVYGLAPNSDGTWLANMPAITTPGFYRIYALCDDSSSNETFIIYRHPYYAVGGTPGAAGVQVNATSVIVSGTCAADQAVDVVALSKSDPDLKYATKTGATNSDGTWSVNMGVPGDNADIPLGDTEYYGRCSGGTLFYASGASAPPATTTTASPTTVAATVAATTTVAPRTLPSTGRDVMPMVLIAALALTSGSVMLVRSRRRTV